MIGHLSAVKIGLTIVILKNQEIRKIWKRMVCEEVKRFSRKEVAPDEIKKK